MREIALLKGAISRATSDRRRIELERELGQLQTELDVMLGRNVPCGCSRSLSRHRRRKGLA